MNRKSKATLNIEKVLEEFKKLQEAPAHRVGSFKVDAPFEKALDTILKSKPETRKTRPIK